MTGPLDGIKVVECSIWILGPYAGAMLGDMGAEVIKVEEAVGGDPSRAVKTYTLVDAEKVAEVNRSFLYECFNRNKRSIAVNLHQGDGREVVYKLAKEADIFLSNFRLGVAERLGIDYDTLSSYNPRLIYAQLSGWGLKGPLSHKPAFEMNVMARSGWMYHFGGADDPPLSFVAGIGDEIGGVTAVVAILAALQARERQGIGQFIDISEFGSLISAAANAISAKLMYGVEYPRKSRTSTSNPLQTYYKCRDDRWLQLGMLQSDRYWSDFCRVIHHEELEHDPRFATHEARAQNNEGLIAILDKVFATKSLSEWLDILDKGGDFIYEAIQTVSDLINDPQVKANNYIMDYDDPYFGLRKAVGFPYQFAKTPASLRRPAPHHGQHTEEILLEVGYSWEDITRLKENGAIP